MPKQKKYNDKVSVVIPLYNEEKFVEPLTKSLLKQDYDFNLLEFIFVDGASTDETVKLLNKCLNNTKMKYRIITNPKRITPVSVNMGIREAKNDVIIRLDAHSEYPTNYISKNIYYLNKTGADNVGCLFLATAKNKTGAAIADVVSSRFGVGNSQFRINGKSGYVDTVPFGTFRKSLVDKIGYFNEELIRSEDNEFNYRIIKNGGKVYMFNDIGIYYYPRDTIRKIMKMGYDNGKWSTYTSYYIPGSMKLRHFIPFIFVLSLIVGIIIMFLKCKILKYLFLGELALYLLLDIIFSFKNTKKGFRHCILMFIIYPLFHISYGIGSIVGIGKIIKKVIKK